MAYTVGTLLAISAFWVMPNVAWMQWLVVALVGAMLYGPQMLVGLCGAETVSKSAVSAAQGFLG
jgi:MFS transporter, OPA family, sugar phosphate sensor protein UhpC